MAGETAGTSRNFSEYLELYNAAVSGDWGTAKPFFENDEVSFISSKAIISFEEETVLHVAVQNCKSNEFVKELVKRMSPEDLALTDRYRYTALHNAAKVGNTEASKALVEKNGDLLYMLCGGGRSPLTIAALFCQKETLEYLISVSEPNVDNSPFEGQIGIELLVTIIGCEYFDVALKLIVDYPDLARSRFSGRCALSFMAEMDTVFPSRKSLKLWEKLIYHCIPLKRRDSEGSHATSAVGDIEAPTYNQSSVGEQFESTICRVMEHLVPGVKDIKDKKETHKLALELVKNLCREMKTLPENDAWNLLQDSITRAAKHGISEIVEVIMEMYPVATCSVDSTGGNIMHMAASNRFENVFNLTYNMSDRKHYFSNGVDIGDNNLMHICARLAPPDRLNLVPGAALQMQRELQWFNEIERFVPPTRRKSVNKDGRTPKMLFTEQHQELKAQGERWMKDTANACSIATALIATVVFAAAFTVPGGVSSETGNPVFYKRPAFILFATTNAVSLFTSITALMMFLSILTSRYAEGDFLYVLPKRLSFGLLSLFISVTFMLVAFSAALYLVFHREVMWFIIPVAAFGWFPVASFVLLQFPLLVDVVYSTYGPGIFGKKSNRQFY